MGDKQPLENDMNKVILVSVKCHLAYWKLLSSSVVARVYVIVDQIPQSIVVEVKSRFFFR